MRTGPSPSQGSRAANTTSTAPNTIEVPHPIATAVRPVSCSNPHAPTPTSATPAKKMIAQVQRSPPGRTGSARCT